MLVRVAASHPQSIFELPHAPGAVARVAACDGQPGRPTCFPAFLRSLNRTQPSRPADQFEPSGAPATPAQAGRPVPLLLKLTDLNPLPAKVRPEIVHRVYRLERKVATGNMIDIVM